MRLVKSYGATALGAEGGREALAAVAARNPDVMFCDLRMPGMDGFELLERLRGRR